MRSPDETLRELASLLRDFEGREYSGEITRETLFFDDLGMTSIDAVILAEKLEAHFGRPFPFPDFVNRMRERESFDIAVGDLADFLSENL